MLCRLLIGILCSLMLWVGIICVFMLLCVFSYVIGMFCLCSILVMARLGKMWLLVLLVMISMGCCVVFM